MMKRRAVFYVLGAVAGILTTIVGAVRGEMLAVGVGPAFYCAVLASMGATRTWPVRATKWRLTAAAVTCIGIYILALFAFSLAAGYSPNLIGLHQSDDFVQFGADVWFGLFAAMIIAAFGTEFAAAILTRWSNSHLCLLLVGGTATMLVTFAVNYPFHIYWSFVGVLMSIGQALFSGLIGSQMLEARKQT